MFFSWESWYCNQKQGLALILAFFGPIARLLGQPDDMVATATPYVWIMAAGLLPSLGFVVLRSFCGALDRPTVPMTVMILAIGANALLNYVLMFGHFGLPRLELIGAGIAGLAAARTLTDHGFDVQVFERARHVPSPCITEIRRP